MKEDQDPDALGGRVKEGSALFLKGVWRGDGVSRKADKLVISASLF